MATKTFSKIRDSIADRANALDQLMAESSKRDQAIRIEIAHLRSLADEVQETINRLGETWG